MPVMLLPQAGSEILCSFLSPPRPCSSAIQIIALLMTDIVEMFRSLSEHANGDAVIRRTPPSVTPAYPAGDSSHSQSDDEDDEDDEDNDAAGKPH